MPLERHTQDITPHYKIKSTNIQHFYQTHMFGPRFAQCRCWHWRVIIWKFRLRCLLCHPEQVGTSSRTEIPWKSDDKKAKKCCAHPRDSVFVGQNNLCVFRNHAVRSEHPWVIFLCSFCITAKCKWFRVFSIVQKNKHCEPKNLNTMYSCIE